MDRCGGNFLHGAHARSWNCVIEYCHHNTTRHSISVNIGVYVVVIWSARSEEPTKIVIHKKLQNRIRRFILFSINAAIITDTPCSPQYRVVHFVACLMLICIAVSCETGFPYLRCVPLFATTHRDGCCHWPHSAQSINICTHLHTECHGGMCGTQQ